MGSDEKKTSCEIIYLSSMELDPEFMIKYSKIFDDFACWTSASERT